MKDKNIIWTVKEPDISLSVDYLTPPSKVRVRVARKILENLKEALPLLKKNGSNACFCLTERIESAMLDEFDKAIDYGYELENKGTIKVYSNGRVSIILDVKRSEDYAKLFLDQFATLGMLESKIL